MISGADAASISDRRDRGCADFASPALLRWPEPREACPSQRDNLAISPSEGNLAHMVPEVVK